MAEEKKGYGKVLKVFRLETEASVSVSDLGIQVQSVRADLIPLSSESLLRSAFESAGLTPEQVEYALQKLTRTAKNEGFLIPVDRPMPNSKNPNPDLRQKIDCAITALSDLADILPKGDDQNRIVEQIEALNVEYQAQPISHPALRRICLEVSKLLSSARKA